VPKTIHLEYFALLREQRGLSHEQLKTEASTAAELYAHLRTNHAFTLPSDRIRVAINGEFVPWPAPLADGDQLVFVPPVAGG
jgi:sulfur-carrier protein